MRGRCKEWAHRGGGSTGSDDKGEFPILHFDYCYLCQKGNSPSEKENAERAGSSPVLVMWDARSKGLFGFLLPAKGVDFITSDLAIHQIATAISELGYTRAAFRSDGERSILAFLRAVAVKWGGEMIPQNSPSGDPQSNGTAEMAVGLLKNHVRTLKGFARL